GTSTLLLHSSGIFSPSKILLNNLVKNSTAIFPKHLHPSTGMSSGPTDFPLFILLIAALTSALLILSTSCFTNSTSSNLLCHPTFSLSFSSFISFSKYSLHLLNTLSLLVNTFPSPPFIALTCSTSFPARSPCLYKSFSPSIVSNFKYTSS
ncbi:hypothetical protein C0J50_9181, partial [Silurus asotus]